MPRTIIVSGASKGLGLAIAKHLSRPLQDCNVFAVARSRGPLETLKEQNPDRVEFLAGDMSDLSTGTKAVELAISKFGQVDGLILNHGQIEPVAKIADADVEAWRKQYDINFFSYVAMIKAALPELRKSKGCIVIVSSGAGSNPYMGWGSYCSGKAALNHLTAVLAKEEPDVTAVSIRPGAVDTDMQVLIRGEASKAMGPDADKFKQLHKEGKLLKPEQPGNVIARVVLDPPKQLSGQTTTWNFEDLSSYQDV